MNRKLPAAIITVLISLIAAVLAAAENAITEVSWIDTHFDAPSCLLTPGMLISGEDVSFDVYSAPYETAWRHEDEKLTISEEHPVILLAHAQGRKWLWVKYEDAAGTPRLGWIRTHVGACDAEAYQPCFYPFCADADLIMEESPDNDRTVCRLSAGDEFSFLNMYYDRRTGTSWFYVEAFLDGQPVWGFIPEVDFDNELPTWHIDGTTLYVHEGVTILGDLTLGYTEQETEDGTLFDLICADFEPGDRCCGTLDTISSYDEDEVDRIVLPESLRVIGGMAIDRTRLTELRLPGGVKHAGQVECLYCLTIGRLILAKGYTCELPDMTYSTIGAFEVEPGNPVYSARDGVLFDAEQKTLLMYPNGAKAEHYDVPGGVERIGCRAFSGDNEIPIKTLSLPVGLREIDEYAFSGLGRLVSIAIPLTVTKLDETAFAFCVSLERVSLPEGMSISISDYAVPGDFMYYNGDNGSTLSSSPD